uniref:translation initiation factor IF-3, mitochondrial n=1 Tax=Jaculus jaculus TaxID=51337 RepID=UPI001E1B41EA|nr:translation initiation factor IF-3, mitochondrial [Jaculus jaculus]XP_045010672.1 translation initiation factor IF-3, mitochondrial [Jaculus jaculus]XP_045010673.1 translation initiation factor IF-3, mitochondrial [Jaculus jaculus]
MALLQRLALHTIKTESGRIGGCFGKRIVQKAPAQLSPTASVPRLSDLILAKGFSTLEDTQEEKKKKKKSDAFSNVGRKISERIIRVFDEKGNDLGVMHRANVIRLMDKEDLRLVQRNASTEPPEYQLMTGAQIHQERLKTREQEKAKPKTAPTMTKELTFSSNIGQHDLDTKSKQIQQWIEKQYRVQITIKKGKNADEPQSETDEIFNQILQSMPGIATFSSRPQAVRGGTAFMCVLRHLNKKEEKAYRDSQEAQKRAALNRDKGSDRESDAVCQ